MNNDSKRKLLTVAIASLSATGTLALSQSVLAQNEAPEALEEIVVTGQRATILSAQELKRNAEQIVDSIVADDIGKLPDRSVTEALQRIPGVTIERFMDIGDPEHFSAEGSGVAIRGMKHVRSELNGRDSFAAAGGRSLSFEDVPAELMAGVDVYKNPSADMIEGGLGGTVNLRTKMPLDQSGRVISASVSANYGDFIEETRPSISALYSNKWVTDAGEFGFLADFAYSEIATRTDGIFNRPFFARTDLEDGTRWVPRGADWRSMEFERERTGAYMAFQWRPDSLSELSFTAFRSEYDMQWNEDAIFVQNDPWTLEPQGATYEDGVFIGGRLTDPTNNGIPFGADVRVATGASVTTDFALNYQRLAGNWQLSTDLQYTESTSDSLDLTIATGINLPYLDLDLTGSTPLLTADADYLEDFSNYYWGFTMPHIQDNEASQVAWRADAQYNFDASPVRSLKVGVRVTDREADNANTGYDWKPLYQSWMMWWALDPELGLPKIREQELGLLNLNRFSNFFRGGAPAPGVVWAPTVDLALGFPQSFIDLHESAFDYAYELGHNPDATDGAIDYAFAGSWPYNLRTTDDPAWQNRQEENTYATYATLRFGFDDLPYPVDGNVGVRVVRTESTASGNMVYPTGEFAGQYFNPFHDAANPNAVSSVPISFENAYTNVLPSLNVRVELDSDLFLRFALSQAISRPEFNQLKAFQELSADLRPGFDPEVDGTPQPDDYVLTSSSWENPMLEPLEATQADVSLEWYFDDRGGMAHVNLFHKEIDGIIRSQSSTEVHNGHSYAVTRPLNAGDASIQGFEVGYSQFFDQLPEPFNGLGMQFNYTYIDSSTNIPLALDPDNPDQVIGPVDTDGTMMDTNLPYEGLSEHAYNLVGMYERGAWSARLAWSWRSEYLMAIGPNGFEGGDGGVNSSDGVRWRLPVWSDDTGQLDGSVFYRINDNFLVGLEMNNITNAETRTIMRQQGAGDHYASHFVNDTRYALTLRATF
ncbi:TonB-dependent receptor [Marinimicrobium alkaliphilum]|uniref:TonB-dependent receptor n=1 Tax=Marinimicrobium alkaliphilum TaxID=2202654 RepID=UPI0018E09624|nr:TonB-dependent receptor [Marinimicrobium alkaliphilum]